MKVILIGAPGSGKGTQSQFITNKYFIPIISVGNILRDIVQFKSNLSVKIQKILNAGKLVDDELVVSLVQDRISKLNCNSGFVLDGFPRTVKQADAIEKIGISVDFVLELVIPEELVLQRVIGRRIHIPTGKIYHAQFNPPEYNNYDDLTGDILTARDDDQESVVRNRLIEYNKNIVLLRKYYNNKYYKKNICYSVIDTNDDIVNIHQKIINILG